MCHEPNLPWTLTVFITVHLKVSSNALQWIHDCPNYETWLVQCVLAWKHAAQSKEAERRSWRASLHPSVEKVLPLRYHGPLHAEMVQVSAHSDLQLCTDIAQGFPMAGVLPDSGLFDGVQWHSLPDADALQGALDHAQANANTLHQLLNRSWREPDLAHVRGQTHEEWRQGKFEGPWKVYKDGRGQVQSTVPFKRWLPTLRFPRVQQRSHSSYEVRPIDDCTRSGFNPAAAACENMRMSGIGVLLAVFNIIATIFKDWGWHGEPIAAGGDHKKAYRQWAVLPAHMHFLISLVWDETLGPMGGFLAYAHRALPFGAFAAVWAYTRIAQSICHILQRLFGIPQLAYVE